MYQVFKDGCYGRNLDIHTDTGKCSFSIFARYQDGGKSYMSREDQTGPE